jgi:hypothetical protein
MVQLIFKSGLRSGSAIKLQPGFYRIGRNPSNDIQLLDTSVSGFHCEMHVSDLGVVFRDVGSSNGSFIDSRRVAREILTAPKAIRLGSVEIDVDVPVANVAIPQQPKQEEIFANFLPDGAQACQTHADAAATFACLKCEKTWCGECVRRTGLVGSANATYSCVDCGGKCEKIVVAVQKKKSLFGQFGNALRKIKN